MKTIRQLREEQGWSQPVLAMRVGVNPSVVSRWERGVARPSRHNAFRLARLFGVTVQDIILEPAEQAPEERP